MKNVFLAVTGMTPQVITETVYALYQRDPLTRDFLPAEFHILTTAAGAALVRRMIMDDSGTQGALVELCRDYGLPGYTTQHFQIHVLKDRNGSEMSDIRNKQDNDCAVDQITQWVRQLTLETDSRLFVSMAGGRKTMGYYLGYAMSLFGRSQDELTHVLVDSDYESLEGFFYPTPAPRPLTNRQGRMLDARAASIDLASLPFVRLREGLPAALLQGQGSFTEVVERASLTNAPCILTFDFATGKITYGNKPQYSLDLTATEFQFLSFVYALKKHDRDEFMPRYLEEWDRLLDYLANAFGGASLLASSVSEKMEVFVRNNRLESSRMGEFSPEMLTYFEPMKSRLKKKLVNYYGREIAERIIYGTHSDKTGDTYYQVNFNAEQIHLVNVDESNLFRKR